MRHDDLGKDTGSDHPASGAETPRVIAPPPLIYLAGLAGGFVLDAVLPPVSIPAEFAVPVGCALLVAGGALAASFIRAFARARTTINPYQRSSTLVTTGPYRFTRNPGYLGMALACAGIVVLASAPWAFVVLAGALIVVDRGVIAREERCLEATFGEPYRRYKRRTRRWL
ncbi:isoprenylcysteine carboxylmethyltransferase family protein [Mycobacterium sp. 663a-19]|uniref:methyltransferase family protein n=1 Tax=Mycobacterium sp. 663a-19 TaxID=2986148 RepID=UPI002D1EBBF3|nr:isoprenylcysteine carboxylmethyltransferase family protein [Mycobacterium sp. 663a-19]MEB3980401.1 isoprenylcysteine carboxylmethyltransferase family protein [Mycobacterium sp. 663a-19]